MTLQQKVDSTRQTPIQNRLERLSQTLSQVTVEAEEDEDSNEPDAHRIAYIIDTVVNFGHTSALCMVFSPKGKEGKITTHLLDPGVLSGPLFSRTAGSILMSGTLYPPSMLSLIHI